MQFTGIVRTLEKPVAYAIGGIGKGNLAAPVGQHVHAGGDHVETAGQEARDQRAELGQHALDLAYAQPPEDHAGDLRGFAGQSARPAVHVGERRFVRVADAQPAGLDGALQAVGLGRGPGGGIGRARGRRDACQPYRRPHREKKTSHELPG